MRAVKQANDDLAQAKHIVATGLDLYAGDDNLIQPFLELGGIGGICVHTHVVGPQVAEQVRADARRRRRPRPRARPRARRPPTSCSRWRRTRSRSRRRSTCSATRSAAHRLPLVPPTEEEIAGVRACLERLGLLVRRLGHLHSDTCGLMSVLRVIPLGGLGEVGKNMTVYEIGDERIVVDAGMSFPRDEHLGVDLILPDFGYLHDKRDPCRRAHARARGSRRRAAVPDARGARRGDLGDAADARPRQVEARRARPAARRRAARGRSGRRRRSTSGRSGSSSSAWRTRCPTASASRSRRAPAASSTPATGSSTTRPSTGCAPMSAGSPSSATAASTCCSATRRTPSAPASRAPSASSARRSARSSRSAGPRARLAASRRTSTACSRRSTSRLDTGRKVVVVGRSMRRNMNVARNLGYVERAGRHARQARRSRRRAARRAADPLHRLAGRAALRADAHRLQRPSGDQGRARRHGDHLGASGARATSCACTTRSTG